MSYWAYKWGTIIALFLLGGLIVSILYPLDLTPGSAGYNNGLPAALLAAAMLPAWLAIRAQSGHEKHCSPSAPPRSPWSDPLGSTLSIILDQLPEALLLMGLDNIVCYQNNTARQLFGLGEGAKLDEEGIARILSLPLPELRPIYDACRPGSHFELEGKRLVQGQERLFKYKISVIEEGSQTYRLISAIDVTEVMMIRLETDSSNSYNNQFLANISHEVRTPMIGVLGAVDLLEQSPLNPKQVEHLNIIRECSEQLLTIINALLDVSNIETGQVEVSPTSCRIRAFLSRCLKTVEPLLKAKALKVQMQVDEELPETVLLDQAKMQHIITNILGNAVKFTQHGSISISARRSGDNASCRLLLTVQDTGIGITPEALPQIFAPFTQADSSSTREYGGTGLGLYICQQLANLMGGSIRVESQPGVGSTFYIEVPLHEAAPPSNLESNEEYPFRDSGEVLGFEAPRVLLTEDNLLNQKIVAQMLYNYGFHCQVAANGLECLEALHREFFDVVLLDMQMPVMDGYETAAMIRQDPSLSQIPVIAVTAHSMVGDREKCLASGCDDYISKPFKARELAEMITRHLQSRSRDAAVQSDSSIINELMPELLEMLGEMLESLYACWQKKDLAGLQSLGHDIKGTAGMYGLSEISQLAAQLEKAAREHEYSAISALISQLDDKYGQVRVECLAHNAERLVFY